MTRGLHTLRRLNRLSGWSVALLIGPLVSAGCADTSKKSKAGDDSAFSVPALGRAAREYKVPERHLLTAAYVQSMVGGSVLETKELALAARREPVFGMPLASMPTDSKDTLDEKSLSLAKMTSELAAKRQPKNDFDWLLCIAQTIVGEEEKDPNIRDHQIRMLLLQMIDANNSGFAVFFADGSKAVVPPVTSGLRIESSALDPGRSRYITSFGLNSTADADFALTGDAGLIAEDRPEGGKFTLQIRACQANALVCFDELRTSRESGIHFIAYKIGPAQWEMVQLQPLIKDLKWYGQKQTSTVVVAIAGIFNGLGSQKRVDWLDWSDYVALRKNFNDVLTKSLRVGNVNVKDKTVAGTPYFSPDFLAETLRPVLNPSAEGIAATPAKKQNFALPGTWDSSLFQEMMSTAQEPRSFSQIRVQRPVVGSQLPGTSENIVFLPDPEATEVLVYQDKTLAIAGEPWDLILKKDVIPGDNTVEFDQQFLKKGINNSNERALKFVSRKANGQIVSSKIVRFLVSGIK